MELSEALLGRTLVIVAHPDDETVGAGALLQRIAEPIVVFCTDGAPGSKYFWENYGSRLRYARLRQDEARQALSLAGISELLFLADEAGAEELFVDQELHRAIPQAMGLLDGIVRRHRPSALVTLAYEGGHPDHDVCSFLASELACRCSLPVWEFPLYHRLAEGGSGEQAGQPAQVFQRFPAPSNDETVLEITADELGMKQQMLAAYGSQSSFLREFDPRLERFRPQHAYDYSQPPHPGVLNYEAWQWPVTGKDVCGSFAAWRTSQRRRVA